MKSNLIRFHSTVLTLFLSIFLVTSSYGGDRDVYDVRYVPLTVETGTKLTPDKLNSISVDFQVSAPEITRLVTAVRDKKVDKGRLPKGADHVTRIALRSVEDGRSIYINRDKVVFVGKTEYKIDPGIVDQALLAIKGKAVSSGVEERWLTGRSPKER